MATPLPEVRLKNKTVLNVLPALEAGCAAFSTLDMVAALRDAGARVLVVSSGGRLAAGLGAAHVCLPTNTRNPIGLWRNSARLRALIAREGVDLVHAHSPAPAWSAWLAARRAGVPFVTTFHSICSASNAAKRAYNRIMTRGDLVIADSNFAAEHMKATYDCPPSRIRVVHHGIDVAMFDPSAVPARKKAALRAAWRVREEARVVLLPGRFTHRKGHGVLIEAVRQLTLSDANLVAVFVGSDEGHEAYRRELEEQAYGLSVRFFGHTDDMATAYAVSDVVADPSVRPGSFGLVLAEAGAMGLPVVSSNIGSAREILREGDTGWLAQPGNPGAFAAGIRQALAAAGPALTARARAHVLSCFTRERMWADTLAVYRELL